MKTSNKEINDIRDSLQNVPKLSEGSKLSLQLKQIQKSVADIQSREESLERAILVNPSKALEIPLIQRDLENIKVTEQANIVLLREGVDRVYDLTKWLLGAMAVSIITLGIGNFVKEK